MEGASVPNTDQSKPDEPEGVKSADGELARAYERIKSADEDLARLDRLVAGMEHDGGGPPIQQEATAAEPGGATVNEAPASEKTLEKKAPPPGESWGRPMLLALAGFLFTICIFGAAFASRYGNEAKAIMARWAPPAATAQPAASEPPGPAQSLVAQVTDKAPSAAVNAPQQPVPQAAPSQKETKAAPSAGASTSADQTSADLVQSLKAITSGLASINEKLDQLRSTHDQTLREHADAIQQLKTTQEQGSRDNARISEQIKALQAQLAALAAKSSTPSPKKESEAAPRQRQSVIAAPARPRRPPGYWRPPPYMAEPWDEDPYW
jgi:hypothetical protein